MSCYSLWLVLGYMTTVKQQQVFVIALFGGYSKPSDLSYLTDIITELNDLLKVELSHMENCALKFCVCPAMATAAVRCVKQCTGYYGCDKC
jgi:hypothetical protein